jgi:hypothetical protein
MFNNKFEYVTEELKDYDNFMEQKIREEINFHVVRLTQAIEQEGGAIIREPLRSEQVSI